MKYFVRHGLSKANVDGVFAGKKDGSSLVEEGRAQAVKTGEAILAQDIKVARIFSSPSPRAKETAIIIATTIGFDALAIVYDDRINEYDMGELTGSTVHKMTSAELVSAPGAEDPINFLNRILACLSDMDKGTTRNHEDILVVSHAGVGRMLETFKEDKDPATFYDRPPIGNAEVVPIDWVTMGISS